MAIRCPTLVGLLEDLKRVDDAGLLEREPPPPRPGPRLEAGRDLDKVTWPGVGEFWLSRAQRAVVRILIESYLHSRSPEVPQQVLLQAAGRAGSRYARLESLFRNSAAWGRLIVPGSAGTYRVPDLPEEAAPAEEKVEPCEE